MDLFVSNSSTDTNELFKNNGNLTFTKTKNSIENNVGDTYGAAWGDCNNDGLVDLYLNNMYTERNFFYINQGNGVFVPDTGINIAQAGKNILSCGANWVDIDNDGDLDIYIINGNRYEAIPNNMFLNNGDGSFSEITLDGITTDSTFTVSSVWGDFDNNGHIDLITINYDMQKVIMHNYLYLNKGGLAFVEITDEPFFKTGNRAPLGISSCDYDNDGDLDLYISTGMNPYNNAFYENIGNNNNYLQLKCRGVVSNSMAIGTKVKIKANGFWQTRVVGNRTSTYSQSSLVLHFGLGQANRVDTLIVEWPSGIVNTFNDISPNQLMEITEELSISGQITAGGIPLDRAILELYRAGATNRVSYVDTLFNINGNYCIKGIPAGNYLLLAVPYGPDSLFFDATYYGEDVNPFGPDTIHLNGNLKNRNINLARNTTASHSIKGQVFAGANPLDSGRVELVDINNPGTPAFDETIQNGDFNFKWISPGTYFLRAIPSGAAFSSYYPTYYPNGLDWQHADTLITQKLIFDMTLRLISKTANTIENKGGQAFAQVYPNPCSSQVQIATKHEYLPFQVKIVDSKGTTVLAQTCHSPTTQINTQNLQKGIYLVQILSNKKSMVRKLVVNSD